MFPICYIMLNVLILHFSISFTIHIHQLWLQMLPHGTPGAATPHRLFQAHLIMHSAFDRQEGICNLAVVPKTFQKVGL